MRNRWISTALVAVTLLSSVAKCTLVQADEIYDWSNTAANNNNAPPDGFPENMNYSEVNDAARELMAVVKRYVEATDGTNTTAGTEPAYTLSSGQSLSTGAAGRIHVWTAHATSTGSVTLNVDAAGAKNVVDAAGVQLGSGGIVSGGVYMSVETASAHRVIGSLATPAVTGPASSTDNAVVRFDGAGGTTIQNSGVIVDDSNNVSGMGTLSSGTITTSGSLELGHASDTTVARASAGNVTVEGNALYRAGGTDVPVTDGGSGRSTATAYAVITGGTTSTGAHQSVVSVGTSGQVLTSNGAAQLPTFQDATGAGADVQTFTTDGTWTKPAGFDVSSPVLVRTWGGGGSGGLGGTGNGGGGGGGGAYVEGWFLLSDLGATETVTVGDGGAALTVAGVGNPGENTTFGSLVTAYGGAGGDGNGTVNGGGGGGGLLSAGTVGGANGGAGGGPDGGAGGNGAVGGDSSFGGGGGGDGGTSATQNGGNTAYGGGGGAGGHDDTCVGNCDGGDSVYGGGGGGGEVDTTFGSQVGGTSVFGGNGGAGSTNADNATAGTAPSGGGGGSETGNSGAGARGQVEVYVFPAS